MLHIRLFGGMEACGDDEKPLPGLGPQLRHLLAFLTLHAPHHIETSRLWNTLWPDSETADIVRKSLGRLREALGPEAARLSVENGLACLDLQGAEVDTKTFARCIKEGTPQSLEQAVKLYRGALLADWEDAWLQEFREDFEITYLDALKTLAEYFLQAQNYLKAAYFLRRFVNGCPEMEWGWETLIQTYLLSGSRLKVLETYRAYSAFLRRESRSRGVSLSPSAHIETLIASARQEETRALEELPEAPVLPANETLSASHALGAEAAGGAVPLHSVCYIERPEDRLVYAALAQPGSTVLIKGPRQTGKTSLLARALHQARQQGARVLLTDWQNISHAELDSAETFFLSLAHTLADQLDLDDAPETVFHPQRPPSANFERFLRRQVFPAVAQPIVWGIDEADRLFPCAYRDDVFGKLRAWHNERALDPEGPWQRFSLLIAYSTEANLFIKNMNQSPFNVGTRVTLPDFTPAQVQELNARCGSPLNINGLERLQALIGGHPYLARRSLLALQQEQTSLDALEAGADREGGLFADHLDRIRFALLLDAELTDAVRRWLRENTVPTPEAFLRLCAAGLMTGASPVEMRPRCALYHRYLQRLLA